MAKSARSTTVKRNNANLRAKIFGPAVDERTARLSARLQELVSKPGPNEGKAMEVDEADESSKGDARAAAQLADSMDIDTKGASSQRKPSSKRKTSKIEKKNLRKKPKNQIIFPTSAGKRKRIAQSKKKSV